MTDLARLSIAIDTGDLKKARSELDKLQKTGKTTESSLKKLPSVFTAIIASMAVREVVRYADSMTLVNSKLKLVTSSTEELTDVQEKLFNIAQESRVGFEDTVDLYSRMARSTKELGVSSDELLGVTETISKSMLISGGSAESMNAALIQLGQGFASGQLRGQELNSVLEQTPRLARVISDGMGIAYGDLRKYAEQGLLTSESIINAIKKEAKTVDSEYGQMALTVGQSITRIDNSFGKFIGTLNKTSGATELLAGIFSGFSGVLDDITAKMKDLDAISTRRRKISILGDLSEEVKQLDIIKSRLEQTKKTGGSIFTGSLDSLTKDYENQIKVIDALGEEYANLYDVGSEKAKEASEKIKSLTQQEIDAKIKGHKEVNAHVEAYYKRQEELHNIQLSLTEAGDKFRIDAENRRHKALMFELDIKRKQAKLIEDSDLKAIATAEVNYEIAEAELDHRLALGTLTESQYAMSMDLQNQYKNNVIKDYTYMGQAIRSLKDGMESEFGQFFDYLDDGFMDFGDLAKDILHQIYMDLIKMQFTQPAVSGIGDFLSGLGGGTNGSVADAGTLFEGGASGWFAKGDSFSGSPSLSSHSNSVVSSPTPFFFASGGTPGTNLGVMGEAGSEAIMPLTRMSGGDLGVKTTAANVSVTIINNANAEVSTQEDNEGNITVILDAVANSISRGTGNIGSAMESTFGLSR